jgi:hypothetical protein
MKVPRQCPLVLVKMGWRHSEVKKAEMKGGARREERDFTALNYNPECRH